MSEKRRYEEHWCSKCMKWQPMDGSAMIRDANNHPRRECGKCTRARAEAKKKAAK